MDDPTHYWYLGTGRGLAGLGVNMLADLAPFGRVEDRQSFVFQRFKAFCRARRQYPAIPSFVNRVKASLCWVGM